MSRVFLLERDTISEVQVTVAGLKFSSCVFSKTKHDHQTNILFVSMTFHCFLWCGNLKSAESQFFQNLILCDLVAWDINFEV